MSFNKTASLNEGQTKAEAGFLEFLFNDEKEMIISGPGGYGKTHLVQHLIDNTVPQYFDTCGVLGIDPAYDEVALTATTNKAASVLELATGRETKTIQSYTNLTVIPDFTTGISKLKKRGDFTVKSRNIVFIDECSMIDTSLDKYIGEGYHKSKIIYVGDHCQMAPVGERLSPVYRKGLRFYELTEPMRNASQPALMALCNQLRETVETGIFKAIDIVPGVIDHVDNIQLDQELKLNFAQQTMEYRCLTFTNNRAIQYNDHIRTIRGLPDEFTVGEVLVNNSVVKISPKTLIGVDQELIIESIGAPDKLELKDAELEYIPIGIKLIGSGASFTVKCPVDIDHWNRLLKYYSKIKAWDIYYILKDQFADLRPHDACTVYKAQGSTHHTVYIDLTDISKCNIPDQVARMLYVAVSRAKERVVLYGNLSAKYGGINI